MEQLLQQILENLNQLQTDFNENKTQTVTKSDIDELQQIGHALRDGQEELKAQLDALSMSLNHLQGSQTRIEKVIETLALRSLEQETDLRDLKRIK